MTIDLERLKQKLEKINGRGQQQTQRPSHVWAPEPGTYEVRVLPWPDVANVPDRPFAEIFVYYDLKGMRAPDRDQPDPVRELRNALFDDRTEENLAMAKKLRPKHKPLVPIEVGGEVKLWSLQQSTYKELLQYITDDDEGDFSDSETGYAFKVTITDSGKKFGAPGKERPVNDFSLRKKGNAKLTAAQRALLDKIPDLNEVYPQRTYAELDAQLKRFLNVGPSGEAETRGGDKLIDRPKTASVDDVFDSLMKND